MNTDEALQSQRETEARSETIQRSYEYADAPARPSSIEAARELVELIIERARREAAENGFGSNTLERIAYSRAIGELTGLLAIASEDNVAFYRALLGRIKSEKANRVVS